MSENSGNFKNRVGELTQKFRSRTRGFGESLKRFEPTKVAEWATDFVQRGQNIAVYGKIATIVLCSYFVSDLAAIVVGKYLPEAPQSHKNGFNVRRARSLDDYNVIMSRNLFNSNGIIPGEETTPGLTDMGGAPVRTSLPFNLIGTMILIDELRSIATIEDKNANQVYPLRIQDEIPSKAKILKIEPRRVIFINEENHHREFVELPETVDTGQHVTVGNRATGVGIERVTENAFTVSRTEVDRALSDLNNILTQARAVPNFENGQPSGYKLFQIVPGSIYQKLGIQEGDIVCGFDGQPANDPAAAFEKLSNLKNSSHLDLCLKRNGRQQTYSYDFK